MAQSYNKNAMLASVLVVGVLAWAIHNRERSGPKYEITGKYEELSHVNHAPDVGTISTIDKIPRSVVANTRKAPFISVQ